MNVNLKNFFIKIIVINASIIFLYYLISPYQICKRTINKSVNYIIEDNVAISTYCQNSKYFYMEENQNAALLFLDIFQDKKEDKEKEDK